MKRRKTQNVLQNTLWRLGALLIGICFLVFADAVMAQPLLLDDFESAGIREVRPEASDPSSRYLWNQYESDPTEGPDPGSEHLTASTAQRGTQSLEITVDSGNVYLQFYPYPSPGYAWHYMRTFTQPATDWQLDTYNRLRFWVKVPPGVTKIGGGNSNMHVGTYIRCSSCDTTKAESDNGHYYHHFDLPYTGEWHQIIVDTHPDHQRGANGGTELGDQPYPTGESGFNYFDALTRFYVELKGTLPAYPAVFQFDAFEVYQETRPENIEQVYSLNGVYVPATNEIIVGWQRHKDENAVSHEVRYAFSDIHQIGWQAATPAPGGMVAPLGWQGYNGMAWATQAIDVRGTTQIYIAIKPQNASTFRQITIPIVGGAVNR
jgi:hypothetical protein